MNEQRSPERILQTGLAFWASKTLLSAIEMGLFTELAGGPEPFDTLSGRLGLHSALGAGLPRRAGGARLPDAQRRSLRQHAETDLFLDRNKPSYVGGILEMANHRLYPFWGHLTEALRTGAAAERSRRAAGPACSKRSTPIRRA